MSNAIAKVESIGGGLTRDQVDLLKRTIAKGCTDDELALFKANCDRLGLDPFAKQIYAIKRGGQMTIQTSIDGFRAIAERTGAYAPGRATEYATADGKLLSATAFVKKRTDDGTWHEVAETAYLVEYDGKNSMWQKLPHAMLAKCAESRALRRAFPVQLAGVYSREEMDQAGGVNAPANDESDPDVMRAQLEATVAANDVIATIATASRAQIEGMRPTLEALPRGSEIRKRAVAAAKSRLRELERDEEPDADD